jgi:transposase
MRSWRAGCGQTRTSGSEGGGEETGPRKRDTAPRRRPLHGADHRFLTCVADHATGTIVWAAPGRNAATLQAFFDALSDEQKASIQAVSIDMSAGYEKAIRAETQARVCFDPFHVVALGGRAVDKVRRAEWNEHGRSRSPRGTWVKSVRWSLLKAPEKQTVRQLAKLHEVQQTNKRMYRAFLLFNELRWLYRVSKDEAREHLDAWLAWASRSRLKPFVTLARTCKSTRPACSPRSSWD